jgi:hypothetical protein
MPAGADTPRATPSRVRAAPPVTMSGMDGDRQEGQVYRVFHRRLLRPPFGLGFRLDGRAGGSNMSATARICATGSSKPGSKGVW